jgi:hypothetical protein
MMALEIIDSGTPRPSAARVGPRLLALACCALLLGTWRPAVAEEVDTLGSTRHEWTGADQCRGAKLRAVQDALLLGFDISVKNTAGTPITFLAYEAYADDEVYERIPSGTVEKPGSVGDMFGWEASPPLRLLLSAQKYYVLLACWGANRQASYRGAAAVAPQDVAFGEYVGGVYFDGGGRPPEITRWATATHDYHVRVRSSAGIDRDAIVPFHDLDPFADDPGRDRTGARAGEHEDPAADARREPGPEAVARDGS